MYNGLIINHFCNKRLIDIIHSDAKLYLVFEFLDLDLKRYMDSVKPKVDDPEEHAHAGLEPILVKVICLTFNIYYI